MKFKTTDASRNVILVATPQKARELLADSELPDVVHRLRRKSAVLYGVNPYVARGGRAAYQFIRDRLGRSTDDEVLSQLQKNLGLGLPITRIDPVDALQTLNLGVGHFPTDGSIYLQHPLYTDTYLMPAEFAKSMCIEKESAFQKLAAALGAKSITLETVTTSEKKGLLGGTYSAKEIAAELGFSVKFENDGRVSKQIFKEFNRPNFAPHVPDELLQWTNFDPDLRTMAYDRLTANALRTKVKLEFSGNVGFGGEVAAKLASRGFLIGGTYREIRQSIWSFEVEYFDAASATQ